MKQAIIDIGSNSMRLTLYEITDGSFKVLFKEKIMAGLAGYVEDGVLSDDGIECAYTGLLDFRSTLETLSIDKVAVLATASLRNIRNTEPAVTAIRTATGFEVEVVPGEEEAMLGYIGAMQEVQLTGGTFVDIGGASTEIVSFDRGLATVTNSFEVGSLNLYRLCVKKILPGDGSQRKIKACIGTHLTEQALSEYHRGGSLVCVGGTARAVLKLTQKLFGVSYDCSTVTREQLFGTCNLLCEGGRDAIDLILRNEPDRIHTIIPGAMILRHIAASLKVDSIIVSKYGVREGYLCQRILQSEPNCMPTHRTEN